MSAALLCLWKRDSPELGPELRLGHASSAAAAEQTGLPPEEGRCWVPRGGHQRGPGKPGNHNNQVNHLQHEACSVNCPVCWSLYKGQTSANLFLFAQNILVRLPIFSVLAERKNVGFSVVLVWSCCYYAYKIRGEKQSKLFNTTNMRAVVLFNTTTLFTLKTY